MRKKLWEHVKWMLEIDENVDTSDDGELLVEPDASNEDDEDATEQSVAASVAGVTTPLGTGPTYPNSPSRKKQCKSAAAAAGGSYGGGKVPNSK